MRKNILKRITRHSFCAGCTAKSKEDFRGPKLGILVSPSLTITGNLFGETDLLTLAKAYQDATDHNKKRPPEETWVVEKKE